MNLFAIVDLDAAAVVPQKNQTVKTFNNLSRVFLPVDGRESGCVFNPPVGYEWPPQYGDEENPDPPVRFRIYQVIIVDQGAGPVVAAISDPVFDPVADTVTVTRILEPAPTPTQEQQDIAALKASGKDAALVLVRLVDWMLANTAMSASDFSPEAKAAYQALKPIADRLDPPA